MDLKDPKTDFETKDAPTDLTFLEQASSTKQKIWELKVKHFLNREEELLENIIKIYGLAIGQCMPALKITLKDDNEYNNKSMLFDALWLPKQLRQITAGVDVKANPALTLHKQVVIFFMT